MCFSKIWSWLTGKKDDLTIPHPEEPFDPTKTLENTNINEALDKWCIDYNVPISEREYWKTQVEIILVNSLIVIINGVPTEVPAGASDKAGGGRKIEIKPGYLNSGVIAHEQAHNSYALMNDDEKSEFSATYTPLKTSNPLIVHLYTVNSYGLTNDIEGHAELYRYLHEEMPAELKKYYPRLF